MDTGRLAAAAGVARRTALPAGVGLAAAIGGGLLYVPAGVAAGTGPQAPLAYLLAGGGITCLAVAFAVVVGGPFADRGPVYGAVTRVWGSRRAGALAAWPALAAYVALLALFAEWFGRFAPLPRSTGAYVSGALDAPTGLAAILGVSSATPLLENAVAVGVCLVALAVHLAGRRVAMGWAAALSWTVVAVLAGLLGVAFFPGVGEFVAGNFDPLYPTSGLQDAPVRSLVGGVGAALFALVGVEAAAYAAEGEEGSETAAPVVAAVVVAGLLTLTSLVALGVVDWVRLNLADIPAADAIGAYLPIDPLTLTVAVSVVAGLAAIVAVGVPASRTLAGLAELYPPLADDPAGQPTRSLVVVYLVAAALAVADLVAPALYVAVPGLALSYLAVAVTVVAMPSRRPDLWRAGSIRPTSVGGRLTRYAAVGVAATMFGMALTSDPATTLGLTLHRVSLSVFEFQLVSDPLGGHVPALVAWELLGAGLYVVLRDYRASVGATLTPLEVEEEADGDTSDADREDTDHDDADSGRAAEP
ncbi:hypothetical protein [Halobaculum limi]|uniref:hypothetical protein n=1 Tax=Halobaculum limi TaxID=3031916 RepID=UPI0024058261|nr:hypothetical protein [Halobaculum sp. YSMS11]